MDLTEVSALQRAIAAGVQMGLAPLVEELQQVRALLGAAPPADAPCPHPPDARIEFSGMGAADEWQCRACGYHHGVTPAAQEVS